MTESEMFAVLQPCLRGSITATANDLIFSDRLKEFPNALALARRVVQAHSHRRTGRPSKLDRQAELLNRFRAAKGRGIKPDFAMKQLRPAFSDLSDGEFEAATCAKPSGRIVIRANEIKGGKSSATVSRLESEADLIST
ncbi:MAG TPA: hypothetical protein VFC54_01380 [Pseudolabrys sp.]|nr:hypothetical protein [Pseudolabrys sp.]